MRPILRSRTRVAVLLSAAAAAAIAVAVIAPILTTQVTPTEVRFTVRLLH